MQVMLGAVVGGLMVIRYKTEPHNKLFGAQQEVEYPPGPSRLYDAHKTAAITHPADARDCALLAHGSLPRGTPL
jgi:hypothetical protein